MSLPSKKSSRRGIAMREAAEAIQIMGPVQRAGATGNWTRLEAIARRALERNRRKLSS